MRIGLFGGTFDPVHVGHLDVARAARAALGLDGVWFVPARHPSHRRQPIASAAHRFAMAAIAVQTEAGLTMSDLEMDTDGPSFTIETVARARVRFPSVATPWVVITGADAFADIRTWRSWAPLLDQVHFAVVSRPGLPAGDLRTALPDLAPRMYDAPCNFPASPGIFLVDAATADVSATGVRRALAAGHSVAGMLPRAVFDYADRQGLYRSDAPAETFHE